MLKNNSDLREIFLELKQQKAGIVSICTVNEFVLDSVMRFYKDKQSLILIESTANQVNHYGGYSGLKPMKFRNLVLSLARKYGIQSQRLILGADHTGPWPWLNLDADKAMKEAKELISNCVRAGYKKIHIDTSYKLLGDATHDRTIIARRQAELCYVAEEVYRDISHEDPVPPVYVLGTDVPLPGGSQETELLTFDIDTVENLMKDLDITRREFLKMGLKDAWDRVIAYVVRTGADFSDFEVKPYVSKFNDLQSFLLKTPYVLEAHSTDYQNQEVLTLMVKDGFTILKVGPELTFRFREAIFALCEIEKELIAPGKSSNLVETVLSTMKANPNYWERYYHGSSIELKYSLYDRIRYYWSNETVKKSLKKLFMNLDGLRIPTSLIHQYFPDVVEQVSGIMILNPFELLHGKIRLSLEKYYRACMPSSYKSVEEEVR